MGNPDAIQVAANYYPQLCDATELITELRGDVVQLSLKLEAAEARIKASKAVPKGWRLVPIEPTHKMIRALNFEFRVPQDYEFIRNGYKAMLSAAPQPEGVDK